LLTTGFHHCIKASSAIATIKEEQPLQQILKQGFSIGSFEGEENNGHKKKAII
jgi:hypothetical protein